MRGITTDPKDTRLGHGIDSKPVPQAEAYLVLPEGERNKGFIRPYRDSYIHVGASGPKHQLRDLTDKEKEHYSEYVKFEEYPESERPKTGRFWTQNELNKVRKGCQTKTTMGRELSETYARNPRFYGATYCVGCQMHLPVSEFIWSTDGQTVGS